MTRTFIAIELHEEAREALRREIARLRAALPDVRFVDPASLHLTLAFLGELDDKHLSDAITATGEAAGVMYPFDVRIAGIGVFGGLRAPHVIWAGVSGDVSALLAAHSLVAQALEQRGFAPEARPFAPHLTLARLNTRLNAEALRRLEALVRDASSDEGASLPGASLPGASLPGHHCLGITAYRVASCDEERATAERRTLHTFAIVSAWSRSTAKQ